VAQAAEADVKQRVAQAAREGAELQALQARLDKEKSAADSQRAALETERADLKVCFYPLLRSISRMFRL
jgi:hypothetical protein